MLKVGVGGDSASKLLPEVRMEPVAGRSVAEYAHSDFVSAAERYLQAGSRLFKEVPDQGAWPCQGNCSECFVTINDLPEGRLRARLKKLRLNVTVQPANLRL